MVSHTRIDDYVLTPHATFEARRRGIELAMIRSILAAPEQRLTVRSGRVVLQSKVRLRVSGRLSLVRVFVDVDRSPAEIVTVYRTSKVRKYWKGEP